MEDVDARMGDKFSVELAWVVDGGVEIHTFSPGGLSSRHTQRQPLTARPTPRPLRLTGANRSPVPVASPPARPRPGSPPPPPPKGVTAKPTGAMRPAGYRGGGRRAAPRRFRSRTAAWTALRMSPKVTKAPAACTVTLESHNRERMSSTCTGGYVAWVDPQPAYRPAGVFSLAARGASAMFHTTAPGTESDWWRMMDAGLGGGRATIPRRALRPGVGGAKSGL